MAHDKSRKTEPDNRPQADRPTGNGPVGDAAGAAGAGPAAAASGPTDAGAAGPVGETVKAAKPCVESSAEQIEALRAELEQAKDRALRSQAELENYRKRMQRQLEEDRRYANLPLLRDLLPVWDNVRRAIEAAEKSPDTAGLLEGVKLVAQQLEGVLARHHCLPIEALDEPFDPHRHEAIMQQPSAEHPANTVVGVAQTGFQMHDRVVRPSQVIVSKSTE